MKLLRRILTYPFGTQSSDGGPLPLACYLAGVAILVLGMRKLTTLALTEAELFFGILLVLVAGAGRASTTALMLSLLSRVRGSQSFGQHPTQSIQCLQSVGARIASSSSMTT